MLTRGYRTSLRGLLRRFPAVTVLGYFLGIRAPGDIL